MVLSWPGRCGTRLHGGNWTVFCWRCLVTLVKIFWEDRVCVCSANRPNGSWQSPCHSPPRQSRSPSVGSRAAEPWRGAGSCWASRCRCLAVRSCWRSSPSEPGSGWVRLQEPANPAVTDRQTLISTPRHKNPNFPEKNFQLGMGTINC